MALLGYVFWPYGWFNGSGSQSLVSKIFGGHSDAATVQSIYNAPDIESAKKIAKKYVIGTWTSTVPGNFWSKWIFKDNGTMEVYDAMPSSDGWGNAKTEEWEVVTEKYRDTGERWYGIWVKGYIKPAVFVVDGGSLVFKPTDDPADIFIKGDKFPFSK